uniref:GIY-YIG domain-containing protein n=1 Tax=Arthrobotrys musiformis TaxID=47236 RepID=A0A482EB74_9PEZI|nr:hypothetical protein [Arthrobotrys musiformis]
MPALNLTVSWELLNIYFTQSAGNIESLDFLWILRDYTSELICYSIIIKNCKNTKMYSTISHTQIEKNKFNSKVHPWYITGFSDAESCFMVEIIKTKTNWSVSVRFQIHLHKIDLPLALSIQKNLGHVINKTMIYLILFFICIIKDFSCINYCELQVAFVPLLVYDNADTQKLSILKDNQKKAGIYRWVNKVNGKTYIGNAVNLSHRLAQYYNIKQLLLNSMTINKALLKYGYSNFNLEILEYCKESDTEEAKNKIRNALIVNNHKANRLEILDTKTNTTTSYNSIRQAAEALQVSKTSLTYHVNNKKINDKLYRNRFIVNIKRSYHSYSATFYSKKTFTSLTPWGCIKDSSISNYNNSNQFGCYLAGLIEGSSSFILTPTNEKSKKGQVNYPSVKFIFHLKDLPLALLIQKELNKYKSEGSLTRKKGVNAYILTVNNKLGLLLLLSLINGYMRTPKIYALWKLIDWYNIKDSNLNLEKKPLNTSNLTSDAWLSGFVEADGHFSVRTTKNDKSTRIECKFELSQRQIDHNGKSNLYFLENIAELLSTVVKPVRVDKPNPEYRVRTTSLKGNLNLESYLNNYPLFGSKYLDFKCWIEVVDLFKSGKMDHKLNIEKVIKIKSNMNDKRTIFVWDHLNNFYNLDK